MMRRRHWPPADPRSSWVARIALVAAILGAAITWVAFGLFDPFGARHSTADAVSRDTTAVVLCAIVETTEQRARDLEAAPTTRSAVAAVQTRLTAAQLRRLADELLGRSCGPQGSALDTRTSPRAP